MIVSASGGGVGSVGSAVVPILTAPMLPPDSLLNGYGGTR